MNLKNSTSQTQYEEEINVSTNSGLPPKVAALSPTEWLKANLFSNAFNSVLTVLSTAAILLIIRGLLSFIFNPLRQWSATATNMRLLMTQAYPEHQYARIWVSLGFLLFLTGISLAFWRAGRSVQLSQVGKRLLAIGAFILLATLLAPFSSRATIIWLIVGAFIVGIGLLLKPAHEDKTISSLTLLSGAFLLAILSLWVVPYGHHSYLSTRTPKILAEPGTVAMTTKLPWTIMFLVAVCSYFLGTFIRKKIDETRSKAVLSVTWLISPLFLLFLVLRDPHFDTGHLFSTDIPIFLFFSIVGSVLLLWLTRPDVGEKDLQENTEFRIKWPRGQLGSLPADSEQFMMIEDLYKTTDKINAHVESMALNKVNIEFLRKQMDKVLEDIEKLKDQNREMHYKNGNGTNH